VVEAPGKTKPQKRSASRSVQQAPQAPTSTVAIVGAKATTSKRGAQGKAAVVEAAVTDGDSSVQQHRSKKAKIAPASTKTTAPTPAPKTTGKRGLPETIEEQVAYLRKMRPPQRAKLIQNLSEEQQVSVAVALSMAEGGA